MSFTVYKADGTAELFKIEKLRRSLRRSGATPAEVGQVIAQLETTFYDGMRTQELYRRAFDILRTLGTPVATRYSLRRALLGLGPTGFPFEKFLARLFAADGYQTETGITLQGHCALHEIDVAAYKDDHSFIGEAKFHTRSGVKSDLQVAMYSYARLLDLRDQKICQADICGVKEFWLVTNTKFTHTAEEYGACVGIQMLSWNYPRRNNLHDRIQRTGIYPITVLQSLTKPQITRLLEQDIIVCGDIKAKPEVIRNLRLTNKQENWLWTEIEAVCKQHPNT